MGRKDLIKRFIAICGEEMLNINRDVEKGGSFSHIKNLITIHDDIAELQRDLQIQLRRLDEEN